jgi:N-acetylmuramoyl-L-alanine amidase
MNRRALLALVCLLVGAATWSHAESVDEIYAQLRSDYRVFLGDIPAHHQRKNWEKHVRGFLAFAEKHAAHPRAGDAYFLAGDALERLFRWSGHADDLREAVKLYDRVAAQYSGNDIAPVALRRAAKILEEKLHEPAEAQRRREPSTAAPKEAAPPTVAPPMPAAETAAPLAPPTPTTRVESMALWAVENRAVLALQLSAPVAYRQQSDSPPPHDPSAAGAVVLTLLDTHVGDAPPPKPVAPVSRIAVRQTGANVEVVLTTTALRGCRVNLLPDPWRLVVEVFGAPPGSPAPPTSARQPVVVLDPGHGGDDLGAHNRWLVEKDLVLNLAGLVRQRLADRAKVQVLLTRATDQYVPLDARAAVANDARADLFVSIHVNASERRAANGIETYLYEAKATPEDSIVQFENQAGHANGWPPESAVDPATRAILKEQSRQLAKCLHHQLLGTARARRPLAANRGVKPAPLLMLATLRMPAVLVEVGFATHDADAKLLRRADYQERLADAVTAGILDYLAAAPAGD